MLIVVRRFLLASLLTGVLAGIVFLPGFPGAFVFDDIPNIVKNTAIQISRLDPASLAQVASTPQLSGFMRLVPTLTFAVDYWRGGGADPATFKTTNILIHACTAFALAWFFLNLLRAAGVTDARARVGALAMALAWALHPLLVSSVLYAVQRIQTLSTLFLVLALLAYLRARQAQVRGLPGRTGMMTAALLWVVALGCKEDSVLFPGYALAIELTVLRFSAANPSVASFIRRGYVWSSLAGAAIFTFLVVPHYWEWSTLHGRDFSTTERVLTQGRVLCLYLWQILLPLPSHMPFYYDGLAPSRGLLQPWTTVPAIVVLATLLGAAWKLRTRAPLFSLGVMLFFGAHFITSNVIGLELAFEHRNHFALIGAVLAIGSVFAHLARRLRMPTFRQGILVGALLLGLASLTMTRAHAWRNAKSFARESTEIAPDSARAWYSLCMVDYETGGGPTRANRHLDAAIDTCGKGATRAPYALNNLAMLVVLKSIRGDVTAQDWNRLQHRLSSVRMTLDNRRAPLILTHSWRKGVVLDRREVLVALDTVARRAPFEPFESASIGYFVLNDLDAPDRAMPYFTHAIEASPPNDPFPQQLGAELRAKGRPDLATRIEQLGFERRASANHSDGGKE